MNQLGHEVYLINVVGLDLILAHTHTLILIITPLLPFNQKQPSTLVNSAGYGTLVFYSHYEILLHHIPLFTEFNHITITICNHGGYTHHWVTRMSASGEHHSS